ncbi:ParB/RepB/Spo0J family partition protein [Phnomibacter sp. MR]|uniref:ParB/RepB/Spo0J family partition protein n=1 Tax=Phnomibacter sp. MR TaxID=3042318 RepID=UPI003A7FA5C0
MQQFQNIPLQDIVADPNQPRKFFDATAMEELTKSIAENGVLQPILVRPAAQGYMLICGERRYKASAAAGKSEIPAIIKEVTDEQALEMQIIENLIRKDVHPMEEGAAFAQLVQRYTLQEIADRVGKSVAFVFNRSKLVDLVPVAQEMYFLNKIEHKHATMLSKLPADEQDAIVAEMIEDQPDWRNPETRLYTTVIERGYKQTHTRLANAAFDTNDANLYPEAGACTHCPFNSATRPMLFDDLKEANCTKTSCFAIKCERHETRLLEEIAADPTAIVVCYGSYLDAQQKERVLKAKKMGITVLENNMYERLYSVPDETAETWQEYLDYNDIEEEELQDAVFCEEQKALHAEVVKKWEKEVAEHNKALQEGKYLQAWDLSTNGGYIGKIYIRLKKAGQKVAGSVVAGNGAEEMEVLKIQSRMQRNKELLEENNYRCIVDSYKPQNISTLQHGDNIAILMMAAFRCYAVKELLHKEFKISGSDYDNTKLAEKLLQRKTGLNYLIPQALRMLCKQDLYNSTEVNPAKSGKAAAMLQMAMELITPEEVEQLTAANVAEFEKKQAAAQKKIDQLKAKITAQKKAAAEQETPAKKVAAKPKKKADKPAEEPAAPVEETTATKPAKKPRKTQP